MSCKWLTVTQVAENLQVTERTVRRWIKANKLTALQMGGVTRICARIPSTNLKVVDENYQEDRHD